MGDWAAVAERERPTKKQLTDVRYICRFSGMKLRLTPQTLQALDAFLHSPKDWKYGYDISRNTGLRSGTLYPILMRLADHGLLKTSWETAQTGRPPRHMYRLTRDGLRYAREQVAARTSDRIGLRGLVGVEG